MQSDKFIRIVLPLKINIKVPQRSLSVTESTTLKIGDSCAAERSLNSEHLTHFVHITKVDRPPSLGLPYTSGPVGLIDEKLRSHLRRRQ